ncbi:pyruvate formate lyase activating enzyme [Anaeromyces robustus]|uniref:Pyruvate formate lyase activating enzyme n=1 Tax=Anaeromyces robustus TaxID=1754192 RepID=A0A1Y1WZZ7_9FUNG|nr:pyruvate formate lyase activating enzyme [Anaeromyces robustus]|eukprot:ORX79012.1 pyruvate formate lyase activating enzyme [Anaeromyces robustus]
MKLNNNLSLNQRCLFSNKTTLLEESKCQNGECSTGGKKKLGAKRLTKKKAPFDPSKTDYMNCEGYVHSVESMGSLEGPGNRFLLFVTGCPVRCIYCENPDTWVNKNGTKMRVNELAKKAKNLKPYYEFSVGGGGVTCSGGDPLSQPEFVSSFFYAMKKDVGLHTCLETSGQGSQYAWDTILPHTDLVLLCIKHPNAKMYKEITRTCELDRMLEFLKEIEKRNIPWWCRYVVINGLTDNEQDLIELCEICNKSKTLQRIDLLAYHTLGEHKWKELGLKYIMGEGLIPKKDRLKEIAEFLRSHLTNKNVEVNSGAE